MQHLADIGDYWWPSYADFKKAKEGYNTQLTYYYTCRVSLNGLKLPLQKWENAFFQVMVIHHAYIMEVLKHVGFKFNNQKEG